VWLSREEYQARPRAADIDRDQPLIDRTKHTVQNWVAKAVSAAADEKRVTPEQARDPLKTALTQNRVLEADSTHWAIRERQYAYDECDNPEA
jgi:hypothetical protein